MVRPSFLRSRRVTSRFFRDTATLLRGTGARSTTGEWVETAGEPRQLSCSVAPVAGPREAEVREAGLRLSDARTFYTLEPLSPQTATSAGDVLVWSGERWRVRETLRWAEDLHESMGVRVETQPAVT